MSILFNPIFNLLQLLFFTLMAQAQSNTAHQRTLEGESLRMAREVNGPLAQVDGLRRVHAGSVVRVQDAARVGGAAPHREVPAVETRAVVVDVVELGPRVVPVRDHGAHAEAVAAVGAHGVGKELGGGGDSDTLLVAELVEAALHAQVALPEGAVGRAAGHGAKEEGVDLDDLLHVAGGDVGPHGGKGVDAHDDTSIEFESEGRRPLGELDGLAGVGVAARGGKVIPAEMHRLRDKN